ncbi:MAG: hypothetical protein ABR554_03955 [Pyrinomonadaceae bacterium]
MKSIRRLLAAALLTSAFAFAAHADGIIHGDRIPTPTPTPSSFDGDYSPAPDTAPSGDEVTVSDITMEYALSVFGEMFLLY